MNNKYNSQADYKKIQMENVYGENMKIQEKINILEVENQDLIEQIKNINEEIKNEQQSFDFEEKEKKDKLRQDFIEQAQAIKSNENKVDDQLEVQRKNYKGLIFGAMIEYIKSRREKKVMSEENFINESIVKINQALPLIQKALNDYKLLEKYENKKNTIKQSLRQLK